MTDEKQLALVTGTSSGIGEALVAELLKRNWTVLGLARRFVLDDPPHHRHFIFDLARPDHLGTFFQEEILPIIRGTDWDRVALVNNAAAMGAMQVTLALEANHLAQVYAVNVISPTILMGCFVKHIAVKTLLRIVNVSTGIAHRAYPGLGDYGASKAALRLAGMTLAVELEKEGRDSTEILSYAPGVVDTPMQTRAREADPATFPSRRMFNDFKAGGHLVSPTAVTPDIISFLESSTGQPFTEKRFGDS